MYKARYTIRFNTPAFLGDAEQKGEWRTPPFKALIRHWWRIRVARELDYDYNRVREKEGQLLGHAWLAKSPTNRHAALQSPVRISLKATQGWDAGQLQQAGWPGAQVRDVITTANGKGRVRADVYMGYGPVEPKTKQVPQIRLKSPPAMSPGQAATLMLAYPAEAQWASALQDTLALIHWFGAVGSRARNGWGSIHIEGVPEMTADRLGTVLRPWRDCVAHCDWAHAIGEDDKPLIWQSEPAMDWQTLIGALADIKVAVRRVAKQFKGPSGIGGIHLLGYPAGEKWELAKLDKDARLASQLRFKAIRDGDRLRGLIVHTPHNFPQMLRKKLKLTDPQAEWIDRNQIDVWEAVHRELESLPRYEA